MNKKYILGIVMLLFIFMPQIVFADSIYFETKEGDKYTIIEVNEDGDFKFESKINAMSSTISSSLKDSKVEELIDIFKKDVIAEDEISYKKNPRLNNLTDSETSYVLSYCSGLDCKTYFSDSHLMYTFEELENGEVGLFMESEIKNLFKIVLIIIAVVGIGILIIPFIIVISIISIAKKQKPIEYNETSNIKDKQKTEKKINLSSNNNDDPFSV